MSIIDPDSENRKREFDSTVPPVVALVWDAVLQLPPDEQALLRVLLVNEYDFEHPKSSGALLAALATHWGVTHRTARNRLNAAIQHPVLQRAAMSALPEIDVSRAGLDDGKSVRSFTTQGTDLKGDNYRRSRHDRTRAGWWWKPGKTFTVGGTGCDAPGYLSAEGNRGGTRRTPGYVPPTTARGGTAYGVELLPLAKGETRPAVNSWAGSATGERPPWDGTHTAPGTRINQLPLGKVSRHSATQFDLPKIYHYKDQLKTWRRLNSSADPVTIQQRLGRPEAQVQQLRRTLPLDVDKVWGSHGRHAKINGGAGLATYVVGNERRVLRGKATRWVREGVRPGGLPGRRAVGYTYVLAGKVYASAVGSPAGSMRRDSRRRCGPYCQHPPLTGSGV